MNALKNRILQAEACMGMVKEEAERLFPIGKPVNFFLAGNQKNPSTGTVLRIEVDSHSYSHSHVVSVTPKVVIKHDQAKPRSRYPIRTVVINQELIDLNAGD